METRGDNCEHGNTGSEGSALGYEILSGSAPGGVKGKQP